MKARIAISTMLLAAAPGCATGSADDWRTAPIATTETPAPAAAPPPPRTEEKVDPAEWAAAHRTPNQCVNAARRALDIDRERGLRLLVACSERPDFDVLAPLLRAPWLPLMRGSEAIGYRVLLKAIAVRNDFEADFGSMRAAGFNVSQMGIAAAVDGKLTPVVGVVADGPGARRVEEFAREKRKYARQPGRWRHTRYRVSRYGRRMISQRYFTVESSRSPGGFVATGRVLALDRGLRCPGPDNAAKVMLIRLGPPIRTDTGEDLYDATVVACHGMK